MRTFIWLMVIPLVLLAAGACSSGNSQPDASIQEDGTDGAADQMVLDDHQPLDAGQDGVDDQPADTGSDAGEDASPDAGSDAGSGEELQDGGDQQGDEQLQEACNNKNDLDLLAVLGSDELTNASKDCSMQCLSSPDRRTCIADCFSKKTGLSYDCSLCFADVSICVMQKCLNYCMTDPNSQACQECRQKNCTPAFEECSGIKEP